MDRCGIYAIVNRINGNRYIGSAQNIAHRWAVHVSYLRKERHHSPILQAAWLKYGGEAFDWVIIEDCAREDLIAREQFYLDTERPVYNVSSFAGSNRGTKRSPEQRARMALAMTGVPHPRAKGQKLSPERLKNLIAKNRQPRPGGRKPKTQAHRDSISASQAGKPREYSKRPRSESARSSIQRGALWREARKAGRVIEGDHYLIMLPRAA